MAWVLLDSNKIVIQKQPNEAEGFVEVDDNVFCGQVKNKDGAFVNPTESAEDLMLALREERNSLLLETDWWANSDLTMTDAQKKYRQDLRDITETATSLDDVTWPEKP